MLATDGVISVVVFLYADMQWAMADSQNRGSGSGGSGLSDVNDFAAVGFSNGIEFDVISGSYTEEILYINSTSNIAVPGMWTFRVDGINIEIGGTCMILLPCQKLLGQKCSYNVCILC